MFRIRKITNPFLEGNRQVMDGIKKIIKTQFPAISESQVEELPAQMVNPVDKKFQTSLVIAEDAKRNIRGFAILMHMSDLKFCYLDFLSVAPGLPTSGVGGSLYERLREEASSLGAIGIFFECLPDDPALCKDPASLPQNQKRLAFYERYGAYPVINTRYETPVSKTDDCAPYIVYDDLGTGRPLAAAELRKIFRAVLERKYQHYCPPDYVEMVVKSVKDDPVRLRKPKYVKVGEEKIRIRNNDRVNILLFVNDKHQIHHVREIGYVESPVRVRSILREIIKLGVVAEKKVREYPDRHILEIHDRGYYTYFKKICTSMDAGESVYPYVFPVRNNTRPPKVLSVRAGYYCIDTFTPLNLNAFLAARWGVNCSLSAADAILEGNPVAYVVTRPPGHHAERFVFGGFCYFNNVAIAASHLSKYGKVAILDVDYHHGNGQQDIFYNRSDVLTVSIHGHPSFAYPYFSGFREEKGEGSGWGFNFNFPLKEVVSGEEYRKTLARALSIIKKFKADYLVVALGLDTAKGDPTGTWMLSARDFHLNGEMIAKTGLPVLIIQEGGYRNRFLGINARQFLKGIYEGYINSGSYKRKKRG
ncbi:MAG TPA: histone deacetylase family protein [Bacteroidales bacterium]|nr:histone deacetylase family protein [Bacteroidales bacterium]HPF03227.1 histone deacetylase family protein [Bacteroidales bacterium]HRW85157.1 histone deacetylase family protein [Bacteroidales bacterium]